MEYPPSLYYIDNLVSYHRTYCCQDVKKEDPMVFKYYDQILKEMVDYTCADVE